MVVRSLVANATLTTLLQQRMWCHVPSLLDQKAVGKVSDIVAVTQIHIERIPLSVV